MRARRGRGGHRGRAGRRDRLHAGPGSDRPASASAVHAATAHEAAARSVAGRAAGQGSARASQAATCDPKASSLAPTGPPQVTPGSFMAKIRARGYLIAGVDQNTYHFGYHDPFTGQLEGFDIDMIRAVAAAIFGNPDKVEYKAISDDARIPDIRNGTVDIVAHTMTILCGRLQKVDFSSVYFDAHQRVLVLKNSRATGLASLGGQKVCATAGSDSAGNIVSYPVTPRPVLVTVPDFTYCLVLLQQGPGRGDLHRRRDPRRARGAGPVHQGGRAAAERPALRPRHLQAAP